MNANVNDNDYFGKSHDTGRCKCKYFRERDQ